MKVEIWSGGFMCPFAATSANGDLKQHWRNFRGERRHHGGMEKLPAEPFPQIQRPERMYMIM